MKNLATLLVLCATLGAASANEPGAASLSRRDLLAAAFPAWHPALDKTGKPAATMIEAIEMPGVHWPWVGHDRRGDDPSDPATTVQVVPMNVTRLDDTHAVLTTWALPAGDDQEAACDSYYCTYALGTYFFVRDGDRWRLAQRVDVAASPYGSNRPKVRVEAWPGKGFVLGATQPNCHGGACVEHLTLLGLAPDRLLFEFQANIGKDDTAAQGTDCGEIADPDSREPQDGVPTFGCDDAEGKWQVESDAIRIDSAERSREVTDDTVGPLKKTNWFALLKPRDGKLVLVKGKLGDYGL